MWKKIIIEIVFFLPKTIPYNDRTQHLICFKNQHNNKKFGTFLEDGEVSFQSCIVSQEISGEQIDKSSAYLLFYEREDLSAESYMPRVPGGWTPPDTKDLDEELDTDFKKQCVVM